MRLAVASVRPTGQRNRPYADDGVFVSESLEYFDEVYTCEPEIRPLDVER